MKRIISCLLFLLLAAPGLAAVKLPALAGDRMVLQRDRAVKLWGWADPGETVTVRYADRKTYTTRADETGRWLLALPAMPAGGPYTLRINDIELKDILFGDVFLCTGQSNMELPVYRVLDLFADEVAGYANDRIRHILIPRTTNFHAPQEDMPPTQWQTLTPEQAMHFSALAYFTAKELYARTGVPVGLVNSCWGGTPVESWISEEGLEPFPLYLNDKRLYESDDYCDALRRTEGQSSARWHAQLYASDPGYRGGKPWFAADYDDSDWRTVEMFGYGWAHNGTYSTAGSHWLRKRVEVPAGWEGCEATLRLGCIVDADSVYVNGRFVGTTGYQYPPRIYRIPAGVLQAGENQITVRIVSNGAHPQFVPEKPYKIVCNGGEVSLEGPWRYRAGTPMPPAPGSTVLHYKPVCLYNAMIAPLAHSAFKGVIWYQGESNVGRRSEYQALLTAMMADWRRTFDDAGLPFYIVELADFLSPDDTGGRRAWAEMREIQAQTAAADPHARLIKNQDLGEWNDIHPLDKKTLGGRVAEAILLD